MAFPEQPRAVITGAGSGLGRALALQLATRRGSTLVCDIDLPSAELTVQLVQAAGGTAAALRCDVSKLDDLTRAADEAERLWGGTDILVNNAGVAAAGHVGALSLDDWTWIVNINLWGVIHGCHVFVPRLRAKKSGFILNIASAAGFVSLPEMGAYNLTKAGVISLSETLYAELGSDNISVTVACPTFFATNLMSSFRAPESRQRELAQSFFKRSKATAADVAATALDALEQGKLHVMAQPDAKAMWLLKRLHPGLYFRLLRNWFYSETVQRHLIK
jgi:NAD(P)-dependent dehydrogenase (short-subunit alcohol dehydrogenase family)